MVEGGDRRSARQRLGDHESERRVVRSESWRRGYISLMTSTSSDDATGTADETRREDEQNADASVQNGSSGDASVAMGDYDVATVAAHLREEVAANTDLPPMTDDDPADLIAPTTPATPAADIS